jgi:hypothetical protein
VHGESLHANGVQGKSSSAGASGVYGFNIGNGFGVAGRTTGGGSAIYGENNSTSGWAGNFLGRVTVGGEFFVWGVPRANQSTFTLLSDARLKKNVQPLQGALSRLLALRGVSYEWKEPQRHGNLTGPQVGFLAQDVEKAFPSWVAPDGEGNKTVTVRGFEALVVESFRALKAENDELRAQLEALRGKDSVAKASFAGSPWMLVALLLGCLTVVLARRRSTSPRP